MLKNCPITVEDVDIAEHIFWPDLLSSLKGKTMRWSSHPAKKDNIIKILKELIEKHRELENCMDTMFINECHILTAILTGQSRNKVWYLLITRSQLRHGPCLVVHLWHASGYFLNVMPVFVHTHLILYFCTTGMQHPWSSPMLTKNHCLTIIVIDLWVFVPYKAPLQQ
jgi:hypothetical protein